MATAFRILTTPLFERDVRKVPRREPKFVKALEKLFAALEEGPHNRTGRFDIKKLAGVKAGEGQGRIRSGNWRPRYDIFGTDVVLYALRNRKEAY